MKDFEDLTEEEQNEVIMNISIKLTGQEVWYWESIVHKLREYDKYFDSDEEIKKGLVDRIKRQEKEIERLQAKLDKEYRISNAMKYIEKHNEIWDYEERFRKIKNYLKQIREENKKGILSSYNLIEDNITRLCDGLDLVKESDNND